MYLLKMDCKLNRLHLTLSELVNGPQAEALVQEIGNRIQELERGFHVLVDLSTMTDLEPEARNHIRTMMDLFNAKGAKKVIRVIPDPLNNFGLTVMSYFHYSADVHVITCSTLKEAMEYL